MVLNGGLGRGFSALRVGCALQLPRPDAVQEAQHSI